jgi:hypothetical protein
VRVTGRPALKALAPKGLLSSVTAAVVWAGMPVTVPLMTASGVMFGPRNRTNVSPLTGLKAEVVPIVTVTGELAATAVPTLATTRPPIAAAAARAAVPRRALGLCTGNPSSLMINNRNLPAENIGSSYDSTGYSGYAHIWT